MEVREARDGDVEALRDLFVSVYGDDYPYEGFYDTEWLKKSVYDDDTLFLVGTLGRDIVATGSMMLTVGDLNDLIGEMGRLVVEPSKRARGAASQVVKQLLARTRNHVQFSMAEVRTVHSGSQRIAEQFDWTAVGFEPLKYQFAKRESVVFYAHLQPVALELRRNNPRVIPEAAALAQTTLKHMDLPVDVIVEDEDDGYPACQTCMVERLQESGITPLLRIERGRISHREIFGNFSLAHGFFRMSDTNSHYLVARDGDAVLGAVGFTYDPIDQKIRIFELIEFDDAVKGFLLASVDHLARSEFDARYVEVDVSAYSPKIQRTFERLGFVPVAYCPSMVFDNVERLDILRFAKLLMPYDLGRMRLLKAGRQIQTIVEKGMEDRLVGLEITEGTRKAEIFHNLPDGDMHHLARLALLHEHEAGETLVRQGERAEHLYILVEGSAEARIGGRTVGVLSTGHIFGEMGLVEDTTRNADVVLTAPSKVIEIAIPRLERLMQARPRLGYLVARNLARSLSAKLRRADGP